MSSTRIPADIEREDRLLAGLTARQLAVLAVAGLAAGFIVTLARHLLPFPLAVVAYHRAPRRRVVAPEGVAPAPPWATDDPDLPAPLTLPANDLYSNGILDLGADGAGLVCSASAVNFRLRTEAEQEALIAAFARFLHGVSAPTQIVMRSERADLHDAIGALRQTASGLPHPALEAATSEHAQFLERLTTSRDVRRRELLLVFREQAAFTDPTSILARRAEQAASLLAPAGITVTPLDHDAAADALARAANPGGPRRPAGLAAPGETITRRPA